jgi:hypothetical protein
MEQAMLSAQAANTNRIRKLEKQLASITTELQKVCQQLTTAPYNKPHGKSADKATPAAPPAAPHVTTPATPRARNNPTEILSWADRLNASMSQQDKPFMTVARKNKKPAPVTIIPKALPRIEREVIISSETLITDNEYRMQLADYTLNRFNHTIRHSADITLL